MSTIKHGYESGLVIAAGSLPVEGAGPWWSGATGGGLAGVGHQLHGRFVDTVLVHLFVGNWHAIDGLEIIAQRSRVAGGASGWCLIDPPLERRQSDGLVVPKYVKTDGAGLFYVDKDLGTSQGVVLEVPAPAAVQFRFGVRAKGVGASGNVTVTAHFDLLQRGSYGG